MNFNSKVALASLAVILYFPTIFFGWVYLDDYLIVQEAGFYSKLENVPASFTRSVWHPSSGTYQYYRPASISVYILDAWISKTVTGDVLPWAFHLTNVLLQAAVTVLLFILFRAVGARTALATTAALALIVHPTTAGTVSWISGQNELLLMIWILMAFVALIQAAKSPSIPISRSTRWFVVHGICFLLALLTKENALVLPILGALYLMLLSRPWRWRTWVSAFTTWALVITVWIVMVRQGVSQPTPSLEEMFRGIAHGLPFVLVYLGKFFFPFTLTTLPTPEDTAWYIWSIGGLAMVTYLLALILKGRRQPLLLLAGAWYLGFLLPTFANMDPETKMSFILRADRGYLASVGIVLALSQADWAEIFVRVNKKYMFAAVLSMLAVVNMIHQFNYKSGMSFYQSAVRGSPRSAFAHAHLADMYLSEKSWKEAIEHYSRAIELNDREPNAHNNLGVAYMRTNELTLAAEEFRKELAHYPRNILALNNLGLIHIQKGDHEKAESVLRQAVEINPSYRDAWAGLVHVYTFLRQDQKRADAEKMLEHAEMDMSRGL